jgi:flagellar motor switch protein FliN
MTDQTSKAAGGAAAAEPQPAPANGGAAAQPTAIEMPTLRSDEQPDDGSESRNLDVILDIPVTISMEIGRSKVPIRSLLQLNQGSVVELDRLAGEPLDVMVNGTLIAHGEVVVVNERYGIRFTDVVSPAERVQKLR